jgi:hypothetical protein
MKAYRSAIITLCALCTTLAAGRAPAAEITEADFKALQELVRKQGEQMQQLADQVQKLQQAHQADQQTHQKDIEQIQQLQQRVAAQPVITNLPTAAVAAAVEMEPIPRVPIDEATVNHNFLILGDAEFQYANIHNQHPTFLFADFAPIFLYRGGEKVLFEAGFDFTLQNDSGDNGHDSGQKTEINLSFAQLNYVMNDYVTLAAGNLLLPLGTYSLRTAGWLNKFPDDPLPRDLLPGTGVGAELLGALPVGQEGKSLNYAVWGVNGPSSSDGTGAPDALDLGGNVGLRNDNRIANTHGNPSGGARVGFFYPFKPHYDFEIGFSGQSGEWDDKGDHLWSATVVDASLHLGSYFETRGEFINTWYGSDSGNIHPEGWWIQSGYKLAGLNLALPIINNVELTGRYDSSHDGLGGKKHRESVGYIYYFSNTLLFEGVYEFFHGNSDDPNEKDRFILQLSYGF